jgi:hypothetical protein
MKRSGLGTAIQTALKMGGPVIETLRRFYGSLFYNQGPYGS